MVSTPPVYFPPFLPDPSPLTHPGVSDGTEAVERGSDLLPRHGTTGWTGPGTPSRGTNETLPLPSSYSQGHYPPPVLVPSPDPQRPPGLVLLVLSSLLWCHVLCLLVSDPHPSDLPTSLSLTPRRFSGLRSRPSRTYLPRSSRSGSRGTTPFHWCSGRGPTHDS